MAKIKKIKKAVETKNKVVKEDVKKITTEDEPEKDGGTISDSVLDAFDELAPADLLLLDEETVLAEEEEDELDSGDYRPNTEW